MILVVWTVLFPFRREGNRVKATQLLTELGLESGFLIPKPCS